MIKKIILFGVFFLTGIIINAQENIHIDAGSARLDFFGYGQATYDVKDVGGAKTNAAKVLRVILMTDVHITPKMDFFLMVDAASNDSKKVMHEYWGSYKFNDALKVKFGQYKTDFTIENPISPTVMGNIDFHEGVAYLAGMYGDSVYGNLAGRDFGLTLSGDFLKNKDGRYLFSYSAGLFNGTGMNISENNNQKDFIGRLDYRPTKQIMLSTSTYLGTGCAMADDKYGKFKTGENYKRQRWAAGVEAKLDLMYLRTEYLRGWNAGTPSQGVYAESWLHILPKYKIDLVLDYEYFDKNIHINDATRNYMAGLQWWVHKQCRISSLFQYKDPTMGERTRRFVTQFQLRF